MKRTRKLNKSKYLLKTIANNFTHGKSNIKNKNSTKTKHKNSTNTYTNTYYIIDCIGDEHNELKFNALEPYLKDLNLMPDKMMPIIRQLDLSFIKKHKITPHKYCNTNTVYLPKLNNTITHKLHPQLHPQFMWYHINSPYLNRRFHNIKCNLINIIDRDKLKILFDKYKIYNELIHLFSNTIKQYLPDTFLINELNKYKFAHIRHSDKASQASQASQSNEQASYYILKPIDSFGGKDILYISDKSQLTNAFEYYKKTRNYKNRLYGTDVIAQTYIMNPLLYNNKKCHLRVQYLVTYIHGVFNSFVLKDCIRILTAKDKYTVDLPFNKDVHDTHIKSSGDDYFLDDHYTNLNMSRNTPITVQQKNQIITDIWKITKLISKILLSDNSSKHKWLYDNQEHGFNTMGIDFMVDDTLNVFLIECNEGPSFVFHKLENSKMFTSKYFKWINDTVLEPCYKKTDPKLHYTYLDLSIL